MPRNRIFDIAAALAIAFPFLLIGSAIADGAMCVIGILFLVHSWQKKDWQWLHEPWVQCLCALWLYMLARACFAEDPLRALGRAAPFGRYFIFAAALAYWLLRDDKTRRRFIFSLSLFVLFLAADSLIQWVTGHDLLLWPIFVQPDGNQRLTGSFRIPVAGIILTWLFLPVCLRVIKKRTLTGITLFVLVFATIALSGERMALLLAVIGLALAFIILPVTRRNVLITCVLCAVVFLALAHASPMMRNRQVGSTASTMQHWWDSPYGKLLKSDIRVAEEQPIIGVGANHFRTACPKLYPGDQASSESFCNTHPHNIYMEWLIEEGAIGFTLYGAFLVAVLHACWRAWPAMRENPEFAGFSISLFMRIWPFISSTGFFSRWGAPPFWLALGATLVYTARHARSAVAVENPGL